ncbi:MAG: ATP-binding protein [Bacillota bacterium]
MTALNVLQKEYVIEKGNFLKAGEASSAIKQILRQLGIEAGILRRVSIASYEAELNMVIHSFGGTLRAQISPHAVILVFADTGPGIEDVELAMQDGYSTASEEVRNMGFGAGLGMSNIQRCCDEMDIKSSPEGTTLTLKFLV